jgi:methylated-DNA-[protein]-cysteine S-methyltransferase
MPPSSYALFRTAIGLCGIAWNDVGITALQLPERDDAAMHRRMRERFGAGHATASPNARQAISQIDALLRREPNDLDAIVLDMTGVPAFNQRVYAVARRIPPGQTLTYGDVARRLGSVGLARAVGQALGRNPFAIIVPCHRVLSANGLPGGFSAHGGVSLKRQLLALEGYVLAQEGSDGPRLWN